MEKEISHRDSCSSRYPKFGHITLLFCRGWLLYSLNLLFSKVVIVVAVVVFLNSLMIDSFGCVWVFSESIQYDDYQYVSWQ